MELIISNLDDRALVAGILVKNGYTVRQAVKTGKPRRMALEVDIREEPARLVAGKERKNGADA